MSNTRKKIGLILRLLTLTLAVMLELALHTDEAQYWVLFGLLAFGEVLVIVGFIILGLVEGKARRMNQSGT